MSDDINDYESLTPNHPLLQRAVQTLPTGCFVKEYIYARKKWRQTQILADHFWKRWLEEYVPSLLERQKWFRPRRNVEVGDLVLLVDECIPRGQWRMGHVTKATRGVDGLIRTVEVKTEDKNNEIKEQIIKSCKQNALRRKALREDLDLTALLKAGRALELSETQAKEVESDKTTVNTVKHKSKYETYSRKGKGCRRGKQSQPRAESHKESRKSNGSFKCGNCGGAYPHNDSCPARNKKCISCGKLNHFAKVCRTVPPSSVKRVTEEDDTDEEDFVYAGGVKKQPMCRLEIDGEYVELMLDSGASVNLIDEVTYRRVYKGKAKTLAQAKRRVFSYGSPTPLPLLETIHAKITAKSTNSTSATLHVVQRSSGNLLGYDTAQRLGS